MKIRTLTLNLFALIVATAITGNAPAQPFVSTYDFNLVVANTNGQTDPTPPPTAPGVTFGAFVSAGASANPNAGGRFSFTSQPLGGVNMSDDFSQFTGSLNLAVYFEVTNTPLSQVQLQLDSISFMVQRSGTGIRSYAVRSSLDGYTANLAASINPANTNLGVGPGDEFRVLLDSVTTGQSGSLITLGAAFSNLTTPVGFRFYGWNAEAGTGTFSIDNVTFSGRTDNVPEPAAAAVLALGMLLLGAQRFRRPNT